MSRRSILSEEPATEINLSPMIDCIFILLIFFIVTTVFVQEQGIQASKPDVAASAALEDTDTVTLDIGADNKIRFEDAEISVAEVADQVKARVANAETPVVIRAHEKSDHGVFVSVWDMARRAGAVKLSFSTVN